jgi:hypothetical protein
MVAGVILAPLPEPVINFPACLIYGEHEHE